MKFVKFIFIFALSMNVTLAAELKELISIPKHITKADAINIVAHVAKQRLWDVSEKSDEMVRIKLHHRGSKSELTFHFENDKITYVDNTITFNEEESDIQNEEVWEKKPIPGNWINNIKKDIQKLYLYSQPSQFDQATAQNNTMQTPLSLEQLSSALSEAKEQFGNGDLSEKQYSDKKSKLLSRYLYH